MFGGSLPGAAPQAEGGRPFGPGVCCALGQIVTESQARAEPGVEDEQCEGDGNDARSDVVGIERLRSQRVVELEGDEDDEREGGPDAEQVGRHSRIPGSWPYEDGE